MIPIMQKCIRYLRRQAPCVHKGGRADHVAVPSGFDAGSIDHFTVHVSLAVLAWKITNPFEKSYNMPPNSTFSKLNQATSPSKPYEQGPRPSQRKSSRSNIPSCQLISTRYAQQVLPLLPVGQESMADLMRETVKKNFPLF
jgi:hypothetical protein